MGAKSVIGGGKAFNVPEKSFEKAKFASKTKLVDHFKRHGAEFGAKSSDQYLAIARDLIKRGTKVQYPYKGETRIGYVQLMGTTKKGKAKFAFVGTNSKGQITTLHSKSGKDIWKTLNGNSADKTLRPIQ